MFNHESKFRIRWDLFIIILALWNCIFIPFNVAFNVEENNLLKISDSLIDICFFLDILCNFFTTYINPLNNTLVYDLNRIARRYVFGTRFTIDLLASIPFDLLLPKPEVTDDGTESSNTQVKILGLLKMIRLLRLGRIITYMKLKQGLKIGFRIFQLLFLLLLLVHWLGCIWYILVNDNLKNWIPPKDLDSGETDFFEIGMWEQYSVVFYYGILLIVGNEVAPRTTIQTIFAALVIVVGSLFTAFIFGNMAALLAAMNKKDELFTGQLDMAGQTMRAIRLPEEMQDEVIRYMQYINDTPDVEQDTEKFFGLISFTFEKRILFHMFQNTLNKVSVLSDCS
jgi:hypothetical protein